MAWDKGFDFRETAGYVTDPADCTYVLATDAYPVTRNGVTFGWTVNPSGGRDRNSALDARLAGICFGNNNGTFQVDLPSAGSYDIRIALGDAGSGQTDMNLTVMDGASTLIDLVNKSVATQEFWDATGTLYSTAALWLSGNTPVNVSFAGSTLTMLLGAASSNTTIAHLFVSQVGGGGTTWPGYQSPFGWTA